MFFKRALPNLTRARDNHLMGWSAAELTKMQSAGQEAIHETSGSRHRFSKNVFHLVGLGSSGQVVIRKRCCCRHVLGFTANLELKVIGMEACSRAHFLGRALREQGHPVRLMPAQYVKPHVRTNKSDYIDAEAIADAMAADAVGAD